LLWLAGQLQDDDEHKIYLLYPEGNWVEISEGSPFMIIGNNGYGKPILDRVLKYNSSMKFALKAGFLSFNSTRVSANDVDYPIDVVYYEKDSFNIIERRYKKEELQKISKIWQNKLSEAVHDLPENWLDKLFTDDVESTYENLENELRIE
jgi:putative proteasome-type protease